IPIAHRLGLYHVKNELEELWMLHSQKEVYEAIAQKMKESRVKQNAYIQDFINPLQRELIKQGFDVEIKGRPKSIYSVWRKMKKQNVEFEEVYDLFAIRILISSQGKNEKADCWRVYSIVTDIYPPNPKRLRDWISTPKASGYESLHTTVLGPGGKWVEVQVRTKRMDEIAEKGLAAHWKYKESATGKDQEEWMNRIREVIEHPDSEAADIINISRVELYSDRIYVFTPEGDLKKLPSASTVLDFAYDIHSSLGDMCSGAKVNGRIVPIRHVLQNGDKVEIITSKNQKPKLDWLNFVITPKAKTKIKRAFREEKMRSAETGKEILRRKLRNRKIPFSDLIIDKLIKHYKLKSSIDLYYLIATEKIDLADIRRIIGKSEHEQTAAESKVPVKEPLKESRETSPLSEDLMLLEQKVGMLNYKLAKCCNPVHGDEVFGFIAIGKGITIHREDCPNAGSLRSRYKYRIIKVDWREIEKDKNYVTPIVVEGRDDVGILNGITSVISTHFAVDIVSVKVNTKSKGKFEGVFKVRIRDIQHLQNLIDKIKKVKGVTRAERLDTLQKI
ncbi:MAG: bifunctional (p)ppGpp synthetase/guanosine-3',5'-bis(diphosphate) 3'-pyrophosphohydrolase, partial [Bacteroidales bacterium]|nr:bifunctional (p)ppGpp synthetase/guanosine-3',5'-bis(diphosphate) 3'-pyrophosphohydrolase [Bacteroidales bacterium]